MGPEEIQDPDHCKFQWMCVGVQVSGRCDLKFQWAVDLELGNWCTLSKILQGNRPHPVLIR